MAPVAKRALRSIPSSFRLHQQLKTFSTSPSSSDERSQDDDRILIKDLGQGIFNIQLNRPKKCNALDLHMFESIAETISKLQCNDYPEYKNMRCIIGGEGDR